MFPSIKIETGTLSYLSLENLQFLDIIKPHMDKILILFQSGIFNLDSGKVEININNSQIQNIHLHKMIYKLEKSG